MDRLHSRTLAPSTLTDRSQEMMMMSRWCIASCALVLALSMAACGSGGSAKTPAAAGPGSTVDIKNFNFSPTPLVAKVGDTITVKNGDSTAHTFTADDGSFDSGNLAAGATTTVKIAKSGQLAYHCQIHNYMKGIIQVT